MYKDRRNVFDKLNTAFFSANYKVTKGTVFSEVYQGDFSSGLPVEKYIEKQGLPASLAVYDVREYGAVPNDEKRTAEGAINDVISMCAENGGGVVLVSGGDFHCGTVILRSNVTLFIESGASIVATLQAEKYSKGALIYGEDCTDITITGGGKICGNGNFFSLKPQEKPGFYNPPIIDVIQMKRDYRAKIRYAHSSKYGFLTCFSRCENVKVNNIILENSAHWTVRAHLCRKVEVSNTVINNNRYIANADGIDLIGSGDVEITHCLISSGRDAICLKNPVWDGCTAAMSNIHISRCEIICPGCCFKIGTGTTFDISGVTVEDCTFKMTDVFPGAVCGISITACDGSRITDVSIKNIEMNRITCPVFIRLSNRGRVTPPMGDITYDSAGLVKRFSRGYFDWLSELRDVKIENITASEVEMPVIIAGVFDVQKGVKYVENITLKNFDLKYRLAKEVYDKRLFIPEYVKETPDSWSFRNLPSYGIWARHVRDLSVENFKCSPARATWKQEFIYDNVK